MTTGRINQVTILGWKENPSAKAPPLFAGDARFRTLITPPSFKQRAPVIRSGLAGLPVKGNPAFFATSFLVVTLAQFMRTSRTRESRRKARKVLIRRKISFAWLRAIVNQRSSSTTPNQTSLAPFALGTISTGILFLFGGQHYTLLRPSKNSASYPPPSRKTQGQSGTGLTCPSLIGTLARHACPHTITRERLFV